MGLRPAGAALSAVLVLLIGGGVSAGAGSRPPSSPGGVVKIASGGTVTVAVSSLPSEFNPSTPAGSNAVTQMVMEQVWPQAFIVNPAMAPRQGPGLVSSAELVSVSPQTVVYTLAKQARWSDGVPITATDFIYDWHEFLAEGPVLPASFPLTGYDAIASITGSKDGRVVTVVFNTDYADWDALFSNLVPAHIARALWMGCRLRRHRPLAPRLGRTVRGDQDRPGQGARLVPQPRLLGRAGSARPHRLPGRELGGGDAVGACKRVGRCRRARPRSERLFDSARQLEPRRERRAVAELWQLDFNFADSLTGTLDMRQAIADTISSSQLVADSVGLTTPLASAATNHVYELGSPGHRPNNGAYSAPNLVAAGQLLSAAGFTMSSDGLAVGATGAPLVLTLTGPSGNSMVGRVEQELQAELLESGIQLRIRNVGLGTLLAETLPQGHYQLAIAPYLLSRFPSANSPLYTNPVGPTPLTPAGSSTSPSVKGVGPYVPGVGVEPSAAVAGVVTRDVLGFDDPAVSTLYAQAVAQLNFDTDVGLYNAIDVDLWTEVASIPLFQQPVALIYRDDILNISVSPTWAGPMWNAENWALQISPPPTTSTTTVRS